MPTSCLRSIRIAASGQDLPQPGQDLLHGGAFVRGAAGFTHRVFRTGEAREVMVGLRNDSEPRVLGMLPPHDALDQRVTSRVLEPIVLAEEYERRRVELGPCTGPVLLLGLLVEGKRPAIVGLPFGAGELLPGRAEGRVLARDLGRSLVFDQVVMQEG